MKKKEAKKREDAAKSLDLGKQVIAHTSTTRVYQDDLDALLRGVLDTPSGALDTPRLVWGSTQCLSSV